MAGGAAGSGAAEVDASVFGLNVTGGSPVRRAPTGGARAASRDAAASGGGARPAVADTAASGGRAASGG
eukprot:5182017-Prymnesium_polylepis.1